MKQTKFLGILCLALVMISITVGSSHFSWWQLLYGDKQTGLLFWESRLPRTISILLAGSSMSIAGLLMQTVTQNHFAAPSTVGTVEAAKFGMLLSLFFFTSATLAQKMLFAFVSAIFFTIIFIRFVRKFSFKEKWLLPLVGIIYSGVISAAGEIIAYRFDLVQSMTSWTQGSFSMIQKHQYEWLFLSLIILIAVWKLSATFTIMNLGEDASHNLGISFYQMEEMTLFLIALTTSVTMITVGSLPFIGVIVPNIIRKFYGDHITRIKGLTSLTGACLILACDIVARLVIRPYEVSVSLILGILGSLAFVYLLWRGAAHE